MNRRTMNPSRSPARALSPTRRDFSPSPNYNYHYNNGVPVPHNPQPQSRPRRQVNNTDLPTSPDPSRPLLDQDENKSLPPLAGPEIDDIDSDDRETVNNSQPGVDDGFFSNGKNPASENPDAENIPNPREFDETPLYPEDPGFNGRDEPDVGRYPANHPRFPDFPYAPGFGTDVYNIPEYPATEFGSESIPDVNVYQHKKTLAQGMMDLALFSANANQLRYVLESFDRHPYYYPSIVLISFSLIFQVAVGVGLIWNSRYNVKDKREICIANKINNFTIIGIFLVTVVNVFISAFGVANAPSSSST